MLSDKDEDGDDFISHYQHLLNLERIWKKWQLFNVWFKVLDWHILQVMTKGLSPTRQELILDLSPLQYSLGLAPLLSRGLPCPMSS
jgi:hypothetical protein